MNAPPWQVAGYTQVRELGSGASGRVVLATHDATGTPVAIKYLSGKLGDDPAFTTAFRTEARLLAQVDDPHVARLYEYVEAPAGAAIVMELVNGVTLRQMLRAHGPTEPEAAVCVLKGSLLGLAAAHWHGVVHRDYKPENVLVTVEGESKLADFGIALPVGQELSVMITGTPRYMAPEQWTGAPASPAGDVYAATATFYECLTGRPPYDGRDLFTLRDQHAYAPIPVEAAPPPVRELLWLGLAKRPDDRPQPAEVFVELLDEVAGEAYGPDWEERGWRQLAQRAALLAALFPFPDGSGGGTAVASTAFGTWRSGDGRGWVRKGALVTGVVAVVLAGGIGFSHAARQEPNVTLVGDGAPSVVGPPVDATATPTDPVPIPTAPAAPSTVPATPAPPPDPPTTTVDIPDPPTRPGTTTARPPTTRPPTTRPPASTPPPADTTAPVVARVSASPTALEPGGCPYGAKTSTITALASDDQTTVDKLRVSFRYTLEGTTRTVAMSPAGGSTFRGALGELPRPKETTDIKIVVIAVDAAGNTSPAGGPVYVTLYGYCTPG